MTPGGLLLVSALSLAVGAVMSRRSARLSRAATLVASGSGLVAASWVLAGGGAWEWRPEFWVAGEQLHGRLDGVGALFLVLVAFVGGACAVYGSGYWTEAQHPQTAAQGRRWWNVMLGAMGVVLLSANGLHFLLGWEVFTVSAYFLITQERQKPQVRAAGWLYLAASHAGTLCLFAFFTALAARTGSWELGPMHEHPELAPLFWLALLGFGVKAGMFPLHIWLPSAHANAPSHVSALLSGVAIKMGVFGLVRFTGWLPLPPLAAPVVIAAGAGSAVLGVVFALGQHDLKRLLAYHSVENIGIILIGLGFGLLGASRGHPAWATLALAGGLLHVWNHGLFKALLFLGAGGVVHATGTRTLSRLGGLWRTMPWTAGCFALGAVAISGLPPLNGLVSEWLLYVGLFDAAASRGSTTWLAAPAVVLLGMTGALALACFVKVCGVVFLGSPRSAVADRAHEVGWILRVPQLVLAAACAAIGVAPAVLWPALAVAMEDWHPGLRASVVPPAPLVAVGLCNAALAVAGVAAGALLARRMQHNGVRRALTWDCGYARPTSRMQYTAGSFAGWVTGWFEWVLSPHRRSAPPQGFFPRTAAHEEHARETVLERIVEPVAAAVLRISTAVRRLQHGRLQAYLFYLLLGLLALAILAVSGGAE